MVSPDRLGVAWLHLFAASAPPGRRMAWNELWPQVKSILSDKKLSSIWAMTAHTWLIELLLENGFSGHGRVIAFSRQAVPPLPEDADESSIAPMTEADLPSVEPLDHLAFIPPWQMDTDALRETLDRSLLAVVHRTGTRVTGYLMAGAAPQGMHITRVAVHPEHQRQGIGRALLVRLLRFGRRRGALRITVNTQSDNMRSRRLYRSLGFSELGETYPVFRYDFPTDDRGPSDPFPTAS
jgi:ribosomal protein S18 acetylase RimI-like enzyme